MIKMRLLGRHLLPSQEVLRRKHFFVTIPLFYSNAGPHIGHLYSALLGDCAYRWNTLKNYGASNNYRAIFVGGIDEHGPKIQRASEEAGCSPLVFCDKISNNFKKMFKFFNICPTYFIRTTEDKHKNNVALVWSILQRKNLIFKEKYYGWYSVVDECFYTNRDVVSDSDRMISKLTGSPVEWIEEENYLFNLTKFLPSIRKWLTKTDVIYPVKYASEVLRSLDRLDNLSVSRDRSRSSWGITVPNDSSQTIYVWLDALIAYLTASGFPMETDMWWPPTCQVMGKDILKFHAVYWPAFLLALDLPLPKKLFVHGHWLFEGVKMSKSLGNVIDPFDAANLLSVDGLRYFLLRQGVPHNDGNFTMLKAIEVINAELVNTLGNLLQRSTVKKLNQDQVYPIFDATAFDGELENMSAQFIQRLKTLRDSCAGDYDNLMVYKALEKIIEVAHQANLFFAISEPWKLKPGSKLSSVLYLVYETVRICSILLQPVVPNYSQQALSRLGIGRNERTLNEAVFFDETKRIFSGRKIGDEGGSQPLLPRILLKNRRTEPR